MKGFLKIIFMTFIFCLLFFLPIYAENISFTLKTDLQEILLEDEFILEVVGKDLSNIVGVDSEIIYDPTKLSLEKKEIPISGIIDLQHIDTTILDQQGKAKILFGLKKNIQPLQGSSIVLARWTFKAIEVGQANISMDEESKLIQENSIEGKIQYKLANMNLTQVRTQIEIYKNASIYGTISCSDGAIPEGIEIKLMKASQEIAKSVGAAKGAYSFHNIEAGEYTIIVNHKNYEAFSHKLSITTGEDIKQDILLKKIIILEPPIDPPDDPQPKAPIEPQPESQPNESTQDEDSSFKSAGSIAPSVDISGTDIESILIQEVDNQAFAQEGLELISKIYEITASKTKFDQPIYITLPYIGNHDQLEELGVYYYHENRKQWLYIGGEPNGENNTITVEVNHLTKFAVFKAHQMKLMEDVKNHWSGSYVKRLLKLGYIKGYEDQSFRPNKSISRAEAAVILAQALDLKSTIDIDFKDTIPSWSKDAIGAMAEAGLLKGYEDETFRPNARITRAELGTILGNVLEPKETPLLYKDQDSIPTWAFKGIQNCTAYGIIQGDENHKVRPQEFVTRGEAAVMIYKLLEVLVI